MNESNKKGGIVIIAVITVVVAAVLTAVILFFIDKSQNDSMTTDGNSYEWSDTIPDEEQNNIYDAYAQVLMSRESEILSYDWQGDGAGRCVAVTDLTGDGIPELLFFTGGEVGKLHVYTYMDGAAFEYDYDNSGIPSSAANEWHRPVDAMFGDLNVASGTKYIIYTGKDPSTVYVGYSIGDESTFCYSNRYRVTDEGRIVLEHEVSNKFGPNEDYSGEIDEYYIDGGSVSAETGKAGFKADADAFNTLIMYSGNVDDMKVFKKIDSSSPVAMTYYDALRMLQQ